MHLAPPTSHTDVPCEVPNFTGIPAVTANPHPRYTVHSGEGGATKQEGGVSLIPTKRGLEKVLAMLKRGAGGA